VEGERHDVEGGGVWAGLLLELARGEGYGKGEDAESDESETGCAVGHASSGRFDGLVQCCGEW
jgi:hypothetical protein